MLLASYAKINLFLEVLAKRPDNYHEIETLLCSVSLSDTLKYALTKKQGIKLWSNLPELAAEDNLVHKIALHMERRYHPERGIEISLDKRTPLAAGLGGGSSNAAVTIIALNSLWQLNLSLAEQMRIAAEFGSDIGFFLQGGVCWATGRGEQIKALSDLKIDNVLLVNPGIGIASSAAYKLVHAPGPQDRRTFDLNSWRESCFNRLEEGIRSRYLVVDRIVRDLEHMGAKPAMMSGSGSTCFGIFDDPDDLATCRAHFRDKGYWTQDVRNVTRKEYHSVFEA